jgi:hypothetical protein
MFSIVAAEWPEKKIALSRLLRPIETSLGESSAT